MKKITKLLAVLLALSMCFVFCACGDKKEEEASNSDAQYANYDYSAGLDSNGFFTGVKAIDYVTLPSLDKLVVEKASLDNKIESIMSSEDYMKVNNITSADRIIVDGDTVNIDYVGSIDGVEFDGGNTQGQGTDVTIGVTNYIDDFLEQLIGHHPGETINVEVTFPDDYGNDELNGKDAVFVTTINSVTEYERNELTNSFVFEYFADQTGWTTVEDFKNGCTGILAEDVLYSTCKFADELPEEIGQAYVDRMLSDIYQAASQYGIDMETYISYMYSSYGITSVDQVKTAYDSYKNVVASEFLMYQAIAETVGISVNEEDLADYYDTYGITDENKESIEGLYGTAYLTSMALYDKVVDYVHSLAVVE